MSFDPKDYGFRISSPSPRSKGPRGTKTKGDKAVIRAFTEHRAAESKRLNTDGSQLDGNWMGGSRLAWWIFPSVTGSHGQHNQIRFSDSGSKTGELVQKAVRRAALASNLQDYRKRIR